MINFLQKQISMRRHSGDMARILASSFGPDAPVLMRLIKCDEKGRIAEARWRGERVIVKEIYADDRQRALQELVSEHDRLRRLFPYRNLHFTSYLHTAGNAALVILPFAPGRRIDEVMNGVPVQMRLEIVGAAATWLARSMDGAREPGRFSPNYWIRVLRADLDKASPAPRDDALLRELMAHLERLAPSLRGGPVPRGPIHGDYSPQNIFWDMNNRALHVFDVQDQYVAPVALDLARLLCDLSFKRMRDERVVRLDRGLCLEMRRAVMLAPLLDHPDDPGGYMDFITGYWQGIYLIRKMDQNLGEFARQGIRDWLDTVPCA